jgi:NACalpha-BTF3-like transcription factor
MCIVLQTEERELKAADTSRIKEKMAALAARESLAKEAQRQREKELAAVKIRAEDVEVLASQFEMDKKKAERELRVAGGDLKTAVTTMLEV